VRVGANSWNSNHIFLLTFVGTVNRILRHSLLGHLSQVIFSCRGLAKGPPERFSFWKRRVLVLYCIFERWHHLTIPLFRRERAPLDPRVAEIEVLREASN
jgi:hypothetical protein